MTDTSVGSLSVGRPLKGLLGALLVSFACLGCEGETVLCIIEVEVSLGGVTLLWAGLASV